MNAIMIRPAPATATPAIPMGRLLRIFAREAKYEFLKAVRSPAASIPFLVLPIPLYLFFGVVLTGSAPQMQQNPHLADYVFAGWCTFAVMMPAIFGIGCGLAIERSAGLMRFKRALPTPRGVYLTAKFCMAMTFAAIAMAELIVAALFAGRITMTLGQLLPFAVVMIVGALPFCSIGLLIGAYSSGPASPAVANLVFLPMVWLSGFFFPLPDQTAHPQPVPALLPSAPDGTRGGRFSEIHGAAADHDDDSAGGRDHRIWRTRDATSGPRRLTPRYASRPRR